MAELHQELHQASREFVVEIDTTLIYMKRYVQDNRGRSSAMRALTAMRKERHMDVSLSSRGELR
ncbi:hypothetical protein EYF80_006347 [Liparis tanakae]|uniref:Uncharacterized protein n=1 Tax=Liparis tanakae TaxID=230148 RepID=A0A4Z2IZQ2_9TELE|nr:hypothetical protein EYF80_006347 [Liparis tanakae]